MESVSLQSTKHWWWCVETKNQSSKQNSFFPKVYFTAAKLITYLSLQGDLNIGPFNFEVAFPNENRDWKMSANLPDHVYSDLKTIILAWQKLFFRKETVMASRCCNELEWNTLPRSWAQWLWRSRNSTIHNHQKRSDNNMLLRQLDYICWRSIFYGCPENGTCKRSSKLKTSETPVCYLGIELKWTSDRAGGLRRKNLLKAPTDYWNEKPWGLL